MELKSFIHSNDSFIHDTMAHELCTVVSRHCIAECNRESSLTARQHGWGGATKKQQHPTQCSLMTHLEVP